MRWPTDSVPITQGFGANKNKFGYGPGGHNGIDIGVRSGTPVRAVSTGTVVNLGRNSNYVGGWFVTTKDAAGLSSYTGHMSRIDVSIDQKVSEGQQLGLSGATGPVTGPHVHWSVWLPNGTFIDPSTQVGGGTNGSKGADMTPEFIKSTTKAITGREADQAFVDWHMKNSTPTSFVNGFWINKDVRYLGLETQLAQVQAALANEKNKPPKEVVKEVTKVVEKPVEVIKTETVYVHDQETKENVNAILKLVKSIWGSLTSLHKKVK